MRPRFVNSATVRAAEWLVLRGGAGRVRELTVRYGVFDHPIGGRCLVDTGYSARVTGGRRSFFLSAYAAVLQPKLSGEALPGAEPAVDTILLTHMHADHVSAVRDYLQAKIHARKDAVETFLRGSAYGRVRHGMFRELVPEVFEARVIAVEAQPVVEAPLGLGPGFDVFGDGSVLAVDLPGHMKGHVGYVWAQLERPLLYAADAQWLLKAIVEDRSPGAPARWIMDDPAAVKATGKRIAAFAAAGGEVVLCHDPETGS
jgi:glyoxylase-like metal-dependent hydrolase (beta-lactamase superfamily II)